MGQQTCIDYATLTSILFLGRRLAELELNIALSQIMKSFRVEFNEKEPIGFDIKFLLLPDRQMNLVFRDLH